MTPTAPIADPATVFAAAHAAPPIADRRRSPSTRSKRARGGCAAVELAIEGMTCAACAVRIEKKLNKLDDVQASVNYATATARVTAPTGMPATELIAAVERAGYTATAPAGEQAGAQPTRTGPAGTDPDARHAAYLRAG